MGEKERAASVVEVLRDRFAFDGRAIEFVQSADLAYAHEIVSYKDAEPALQNTTPYETDILIRERLPTGEWKPRVVIETKLAKVTTHDAITYSEKAATHKHVHPYLRYGIMLGDRGKYPLPGRLFRHGAYFDFMLSWAGLRPTPAEIESTISLLKDEVRASAEMEAIIYETRSPARKRYTILQRKLRLE